MLQRNPTTLGHIEGPPSTALSPAQLIAALASLVRRRGALMALISALCIFCGAIYLYVVPSKYLARASLIIDTRKTQLFQQQQVLADTPVDSVTVDSQIEVLKSTSIAASVVKDLHLTSDSEFVGGKPGLVGTVLGFLFPSAPTSEQELQQRAQETFQAGLFPRRVGTTYVIEIGFLSHSPDRAAQVANAAAEAYILDQLDAKYEATRRAGTWLQERIQELQRQAATAEQAVLDFKKTNNIVDTGGRLIGEQQLAELNSQIVLTRAATAEARARLARISEITQHNLSELDNAIRSPDPAVADVLRNEVINKLRSEYLEASNKEAAYVPRLGKDHLVVVNLRNQMFEIRKAIFDELKRIEETFKSDYQIAIAREQSIQQSLAEAVEQHQTTNQAQIALKDLDSKAQTFRVIHDNFVQRYMEAIQQQSFPYTEARVISAAARPAKRAQPNSLLVMTLASASGLLLAFGIAVLIDLSESGFRTSEQVEEELGTNCLASVPLFKVDAKAFPAIEARKGGLGESQNKRQVACAGVLFGVVGTPFSRFAEAFRTVKVSIDLVSLVKPSKVIGITSTHPGEGKSTVAANLARLIAHAGGRAVLVDCDLRNPSLTRSLSPAAEFGLLDLLAEKRSLADVIWTDPATSLSFVPMVAKTRLPHTNEILASAGMKKLVDELRKTYQYVLIDLPPLVPVVDVRSTSQIVDSYLFVVEWGRTTVDAVKHALSSAPLISDSLIGVVLNKVDLNAMSHYSYDGGYRYRDRYLEHYGFED
jgi:polysaccharide biosynthesis transport protein